MTISEWLAEATKKLDASGVASARLDCLVLLEDATRKERSYLLAHGEIGLEAEVVEKLDTQVERRSSHEPLAYIRGKSEFYGRTFTVNHHTLEPRPETETIIDLLKSHIILPCKVEPCNDTNMVIVDVGTGSGCIGITAKLEWPEAEAIGVDVSDECLKVAEKNAQKLGAEVAFLRGDLLEPVKDKRPDVLLCNLPYVPNDFTVNQAATHEPKLAIFGGVDGLDYYRELFEQIRTFKLVPKYILTESLPFQHHTLAAMARTYGYVMEETKNLVQLFSLSA